MTTLNTKDYIQAHDELGRYRYPNSYDNRLAYVSLSAIQVFKDLLSDFQTFFKRDNPNFDRTRFENAVMK